MVYASYAMISLLEILLAVFDSHGSRWQVACFLFGLVPRTLWMIDLFWILHASLPLPFVLLEPKRSCPWCVWMFPLTLLVLSILMEVIWHALFLTSQVTTLNQKQFQAFHDGFFLAYCLLCLLATSGAQAYLGYLFCRSNQRILLSDQGADMKNGFLQRFRFVVTRFHWIAQLILSTLALASVLLIAIAYSTANLVFPSFCSLTEEFVFSPFLPSLFDIIKSVALLALILSNVFFLEEGGDEHQVILKRIVQDFHEQNAKSSNVLPISKSKSFPQPASFAYSDTKISKNKSFGNEDVFGPPPLEQVNWETSEHSRQKQNNRQSRQSRQSRHSSTLTLAGSFHLDPDLSLNTDIEESEEVREDIP